MEESLSVVAVITGILWCILYFSSSAVLISAKGPHKAGEHSETLSCEYFTGTSTITKQYWYSPNGIMGKEACPRLINFNN